MPEETGAAGAAGATGATGELYDAIGVGYARTRRPDPRIAAAIHRALGDAASLVNVGAGAGSYEPPDRRVVAVEPSATMIAQRPAAAAPAVRATAERLPLRDRAVDAALAVLTLHHWRDRERGLAELARVARRRVVVLSWDAEVFERFWLVADYLPSLGAYDRPRAMAVEAIAEALGGGRILPLEVPHDCVDGFLGAWWRRPRAYLDPRVRAGISAFADTPDEACEAGLARLADDLESGAWARRHADLMAAESADLGYRLIVAERDGAGT